MNNIDERRSGTDNRTGQQMQSEGERRSQSDRRSIIRRRVLKGVKISFNGDFCAVEGVIKNISDTGALIKLKDGLLVPDVITIFNELDGVKVEAKVVRRQAESIGVHFIGEKEQVSNARAQVVSMLDFNKASLAETSQNDEQPPQDEMANSFRKPQPVFGKLGTG